MDSVRFRFLDAPCNFPTARQRETQAGIGRYGERRKALRRQEIDGDPKLGGGALQRFERPHNTVDLWRPRIRRDENLHRLSFSRVSAANVLSNLVRQQLPI